MRIENILELRMFAFFKFADYRESCTYQERFYCARVGFASGTAHCARNAAKLVFSFVTE